MLPTIVVANIEHTIHFATERQGGLTTLCGLSCPGDVQQLARGLHTPCSECSSRVTGMLRDDRQAAREKLDGAT